MLKTRIKGTVVVNMSLPEVFQWGQMSEHKNEDAYLDWVKNKCMHRMMALGDHRFSIVRYRHALE